MTPMTGTEPFFQGPRGRRCPGGRRAYRAMRFGLEVAGRVVRKGADGSGLGVVRGLESTCLKDERRRPPTDDRPQDEPVRSAGHEPKPRGGASGFEARSRGPPDRPATFEKNRFAGLSEWLRGGAAAMRARRITGNHFPHLYSTSRSGATSYRAAIDPNPSAARPLADVVGHPPAVVATQFPSACRRDAMQSDSNVPTPRSDRGSTSSAGSTRHPFVIADAPGDLLMTGKKRSSSRRFDRIDHLEARTLLSATPAAIATLGPSDRDEDADRLLPARDALGRGAGGVVVGRRHAGPSRSVGPGRPGGRGGPAATPTGRSPDSETTRASVPPS